MPWLPWKVTKKIFAPDDDYGVTDERVDRLGFWRAVVGLLTIIISTWPWRGDLSPFVAWAEVEEKASKSVVLALIIVVGASAITFFATPLDRRRELLKGSQRVAVAGGIANVFVIANQIITAVRPPVPDSGLVLLVGVPIAIYLTFFIIFMVYYSVRYVFAVGSVHSMLSPICSCALVFVTTAGDVYKLDTKGVPPGFWLFLTFSGLATSWLLGYYELRGLHRMGVRLLGGPEPRHWPRTAYR
jgi:hypothetical protein